MDYVIESIASRTRSKGNSNSDESMGSNTDRSPKRSERTYLSTPFVGPVGSTEASHAKKYDRKLHDKWELDRLNNTTRTNHQEQINEQRKNEKRLLYQPSTEFIPLKTPLVSPSVIPSLITLEQKQDVLVTPSDESVYLPLFETNQKMQNCIQPIDKTSQIIKVKVQTNEELTASTYPKYKVAPVFGQGNVVFTEKLLITLDQGQQFVRKSSSCTRCTIGKIGTIPLVNNNKILVPRGSKFYRTDDPCGLVKKTKCDQYFLLEQNASIIIPAFIPYYNGEDEECFTKPTIVNLA